jgi:hypothetical protein
LLEQTRGEYPTITTTRRGDGAAVGKVELDGLGLRIIAPTKKGGGGKKGGPWMRRAKAR